jgi:hypothetical protein
VGALVALDGFERIATLGVIVALGSLPLRWYQIPFSNRLEQSGFGSFGWAEAALIITLVAALVLLVEVGRGHRPPLPLHEGTLLALAGVWSALIVVVMMFDRPVAFIGGIPADYHLGFGIFVALGGCIALALAGLRIRRKEFVFERYRGVSPEAEGAQGHSGASPPRSPR